MAFGDEGLSYTFSGKTVPARPWIPLLLDIRKTVTEVTGSEFNFVLINRSVTLRCHGKGSQLLKKTHPLECSCLCFPHAFKMENGVMDSIICVESLVAMSTCRYKNGDDCIGEHRDDEKDLVQGSLIASLTLGQKRDFVFRHGEVS